MELRYFFTDSKLLLSAYLNLLRKQDSRSLDVFKEKILWKTFESV